MVNLQCAIDCSQMLPRDRHRSRVPVDDDVTVPTLPALVYASPRLRSSAHLHDEEFDRFVSGRFVTAQKFGSFELYTDP